eukprot:5253175-Pyramimonas_sp.AAC.3
MGKATRTASFTGAGCALMKREHRRNLDAAPKGGPPYYGCRKQDLCNSVRISVGAGLVEVVWKSSLT